MQHAVMIEAVENHMPEVIVIDEIGTELEAAAARTIAERGVQLVGTAHGNTLENLMMNPTLSDLVGGIQSVTLGDEEARRRGTQKSVLERKAPPTFDVVVEIQNWDRVAVHGDVAETVDAMLRGYRRRPRVRELDADATRCRSRDRSASRRANGGRCALRRPAAASSGSDTRQPARGRPQRVYPFGISRKRLETGDPRDRRARRDRGRARGRGRGDHAAQPTSAASRRRCATRRARHPDLRAQEQHRRSDGAGAALDAAATSGRHGRPGDRTRCRRRRTRSPVSCQDDPAVELTPQNAYIRRLQHQMAQRYNLTSRSRGREPYRRVRIYRDGEGSPFPFAD